MPWTPELFSAPVLARFEAKQRQRVVDVPYFDGLVAGEIDALVDSFAGEPRVRHPLRGDIEGEQAFREFVADIERWLQKHDASVEDVKRSVRERRGFEEVIVHVDTEAGRIDLPHGLVADHSPEGRIEEIRIYFSAWPLTGHRTERAPFLPGNPELREPPAVAAYCRALAAGDAAAVADVFAIGGSIREADGAECLHVGADRLRAFYEGQLAAGGIELEPCVSVEDGDTVALEYNARSLGEPSGGSRGGLAVFVGDGAGKLSAVRLY